MKRIFFVFTLVMGISCGKSDPPSVQNINNNNAIQHNTNSNNVGNNNNLTNTNNNETVLPAEYLLLCQLHHIASRYNMGESSLCQQGYLTLPEDLTQAEMDWYCAPNEYEKGYLFARRLLDSEKAGRILIDWDMAYTCVEKARALKRAIPGYQLINNTDWNILQQNECKNFYTPMKADNEPCVFNWDCIQEGSGCYTRNPININTLICQPGADINEFCDPTFILCKDGLKCDENTQTCSPTNTLPKKEIGEPCKDDTDCRGPCAVCRAFNTQEGSVCTLLHAEGETCNTYRDCLSDLGCTNGLCTTVGQGEKCGPEVGSFCETPFVCLHECFQYTNTDDCTNNGCRVVEINGTGYCLPKAPKYPTCLKSPLADEPCAAGFYCPNEHYCSPQTGKCYKAALKGEACSRDGLSLPNCFTKYALRCMDNVCEQRCRSNEGCSADEYCNPNLDICMPLKPDDCFRMDECPKEQFCPVCAFWRDDQAGCLDNAENCEWSPIGECLPNCYKHTQQFECLADPKCYYDVPTRACMPICSQLPAKDYSAKCNATNGCEETTEQRCEWHVNCEGLSYSECLNHSSGCMWAQEFFSQEMKCLDLCTPHFNYNIDCERTDGCYFFKEDEYTKKWGCFPICSNLSIDECDSESQGLCKVNTYNVCNERTDCTVFKQNPNTCNAETDCYYNVLGNCDFKCHAQYTDETSCINDPLCKWITGSPGYCSQIKCGSIPAANVNECNNTPNCKHVNAAICRSNLSEECKIYRNMTDCNAQTNRCAWTGMNCATICYAYKDDPTQCDQTSGCFYNENTCKDICSTLRSNECLSAPNTDCVLLDKFKCTYQDYCSSINWDSPTCEASEHCVFTSESQCHTLPPDNTVSCIDKKQVGEDCLSDHMCVTGACIEIIQNETSFYKCGYVRDTCVIYDATLLLSVFLFGSVVVVFYRRKK